MSPAQSTVAGSLEEDALRPEDEKALLPQGLIAAWPNSSACACGQKTAPRAPSSAYEVDEDDDIDIDQRPSLSCYSDAMCSDAVSYQEEGQADFLMDGGLSVASSFQPSSRHGLPSGSGASTPARWGGASVGMLDSEARPGSDAGARDDASAGTGRRLQGVSGRPGKLVRSNGQRPITATPGRRREGASPPPAARVPSATSSSSPRLDAISTPSQRKLSAATSPIGARGKTLTNGSSVSSAAAGRKGPTVARKRELSAPPARAGTLNGTSTMGSVGTLPAARGTSSSSPALPVVEEELAALRDLSIDFLCLDDQHVAVCFGESRTDPGPGRNHWRMQLWPRGGGCGDSSSGGGLSLAVRGIHRRPIASLSLCCEAMPSSGSGSSWPNWLVSLSSDRAIVWRLDQLWQIAAAEAATAAETARSNGILQRDPDENEEGVALLLGVAPTSAPMPLPKSALACASAVLLEGSADFGVSSSGSVAAKPSHSGALLAAVARGEQVVLFSVQPELTVHRLADLSFSDPLGHLLLSGPCMSKQQDPSKDHMSVWMSGLGGKLWSCDVGTGHDDSTGASNLAAHPLLLGVAVHCLASSAVAPGRCYVGGSLAIVQILDSSGTCESPQGAAAMGRVQIAGEEAPVMAVRSLLRTGGQGEEEALVVLLEDGGVFVQDLLSVAGEPVLSGSATLAVSLGLVAPTTCALTGGSPGAVAVSAQRSAVHVAWTNSSSSQPERGSNSAGVVLVAPVLLKQRGPSINIPMPKSAASKTQRNRAAPLSSSNSSSNQRNNQAWITTPRGGVPKRKPSSGSGLGAGQPISSRSAFEHSASEGEDATEEGGARRRLKSEGRHGSKGAAPPLRKRMSSSPSVRTPSNNTSKSSTALRLNSNNANSTSNNTSGPKQHGPAKVAESGGAAAAVTAAASSAAVTAVAASEGDGAARSARRNQRSLSHQDGLNAEKGSSWVAPATMVVTVPQARPTTSAPSQVSMQFHNMPQAYSHYRVSSSSSQQAAAPPSGTSTPQMWRLGSAPLPQTAAATSSGYQQPHHLQQPSPGVGSSAYTTGSGVAAPPTVSSTQLSGFGVAAPVAIQGLASWPTAWVPPPSPAPSTCRLSVPQSLKHKPVQVLRGTCSANASPATLHRPVAHATSALPPEVTWGLVTSPPSRSSLLPPSSPPARQRLVTRSMLAASESGFAPMRQ
eukprot:TRINITY_DN30204_c0_g1_i1.p1 TRINITY_DN30204_c0_g1~~TRINITY_DN30204_c0_g1_i1.p1  ORF type:complete len:1330 (+),score=214.66 TRINITY_DN30204_c0_g1_i1:430-3990(+)